MKINALLIDETDNVVTCVEEVPAGNEVFYRKGGEVLSLKAAENIPYCHKAALRDFSEGEEVIKYGEMIGRTNSAIVKGGWVSDKNIYSVPRDYDSELIPEGGNH
ncbi:MAG: UxaA family hydrolase [Synergistaceae bacterium]|nr:UxaA family hydrolase [Synergistaceae bacterium]MBR1658398.1 UxaA family hydrolase [Synergistaceae bacterium]